MACRQELIDISSQWQKLGFAGSHPYTLPTSTKLLEHQQGLQSFCIAKDLKRTLIDLLHTTADGWVPIDTWEATEMAYQEAFGELLQEVCNDNQSMNEEELGIYGRMISGDTRMVVRAIQH